MRVFFHFVPSKNFNGVQTLGITLLHVLPEHKTADWDVKHDILKYSAESSTAKNMVKKTKKKTTLIRKAVSFLCMYKGNYHKFILKLKLKGFLIRKCSVLHNTTIH